MPYSGTTAAPATAAPAAASASVAVAVAAAVPGSAPAPAVAAASADLALRQQLVLRQRHAQLSQRRLAPARHILLRYTEPAPQAADLETPDREIRARNSAGAMPQFSSAAELPANALPVPGRTPNNR